MVIGTLKPVAVDFLAPNVGVKAAPTTDVAVTVFEPPVYPVLVVLIVAVELVSGATPVTVTKPVRPVPVTTTVPDAVAVPAHV